MCNTNAPLSPLPWSSQNFYMLLKYCIFINTLLTYIGLMWWIGHERFRLVFVDEIFHKLRRHSVDMLLLYMFNLSRLCFISHFTLFHRILIIFCNLSVQTQSLIFLFWSEFKIVFKYIKLDPEISKYQTGRVFFQHPLHSIIQTWTW